MVSSRTLALSRVNVVRYASSVFRSRIATPPWARVAGVEPVVERVVEARDEVEAADHRQVADVGVEELRLGRPCARPRRASRSTSRIPSRRSQAPQERQEALARPAGEVENGVAAPAAAGSELETCAVQAS
ncbi:MAG TPA: hypothetical protein VF056_06755 [Thermoleophilaceae bacterium]